MASSVRAVVVVLVGNGEDCSRSRSTPRLRRRSRRRWCVRFLRLSGCGSRLLSLPLLFLKEISSNGNSQTVDVIFPAFPFFLYTNPRWLAYLLEPLIEHMLSGQYPNQYTMHDLGTHFPNLTGHADGRDEYMPVEECGDMLIMGLALVNSLKYDQGFSAQSIWSTLGDDTEVAEDSESVWPLTNVGVYNGMSYMDDSWGGGARGIKQAEKWLKRSYRIWKQWTSYLVEFSLEPHNQRKSGHHSSRYAFH